MQIAGIIAEYNPFHFGHQWQIEALRAQLGPDTAVIVVLSSHFVQRGEPALLDKYARAQLAIALSADLVLELPTLFSCAAAGHFAQAGVALLGATGLNLCLVCGRESLRYEDLHHVAALIEEEGRWRPHLVAHLTEGRSFASARARALAQQLASDEAEADPAIDVADREAYWRDLLRQPNNILAIEYLVARRRLGLTGQIRSLLLPRRGPEEMQILPPRPQIARPNKGLPPVGREPSVAFAGRFTLDYARASTARPEPQHWASASALRTALEGAQSPSAVYEALLGRLPALSLATLAQAARHHQLYRLDDLSPLLLSKLLTAKPQTLDRIDGLSEGLGRRLQNALHEEAPRFDRLATLIQATVTKRFPQTRIQRACLALALDLDADKAQMLRETGPAYLRPLAFSKRGQYLLKKMRRLASLPLISQVSDFYESPLDSPLRLQGQLDLQAGQLLALSHRQSPDFEMRAHPRLVKSKWQRPPL